jgi:hypothetical protein
MMIGHAGMATTPVISSARRHPAFVPAMSFLLIGFGSAAMISSLVVSVAIANTAAGGAIVRWFL